MPANPSAPKETRTEMFPNPAIEGMLYDSNTGEYYPHSTLPSGEFETVTTPGIPGVGDYRPEVPERVDYIAEAFPAPREIPMITEVPQGMARPLPDFQPTEAAMAGKQVPLSFAEQDQMRNELIADYTQRIGTDRAEKLMGEQFKIHRDEQGNPVAYSLGKSLMPAKKSTRTYTEKDFVESEVGGVPYIINKHTGDTSFPRQEGVVAGAVTALKKTKEMNKAALIALKNQGVTEVYLDPETKQFKNADRDDSLMFDHPKIPINEAIASQTTEEENQATQDFLEQ
jgi:hypothetical protein